MENLLDNAIESMKRSHLLIVLLCTMALGMALPSLREELSHVDDLLEDQNLWDFCLMCLVLVIRSGKDLQSVQDYCERSDHPDWSLHLLPWFEVCCRAFCNRSLIALV